MGWPEPACCGRGAPTGLSQLWCEEGRAARAPGRCQGAGAQSAGDGRADGCGWALGMCQGRGQLCLPASGSAAPDAWHGCGRHYLGDRLLAQGASWLEGAIVEQLGLCFPSRFPQQMLSNLAQSEELQQQFRLFRLQEQDKQLLELAPSRDGVSMALGQGGWGPLLCPAAVLGAQLEAPLCPCAQAARPGSVAAVPEVKVLTLSPRCWPVSPLCHMDEPGRFFSAALSSPLEEFATFCRHSECGGRGAGPPRQLSEKGQSARCAGGARPGCPQPWHRGCLWQARPGWAGSAPSLGGCSGRGWATLKCSLETASSMCPRCRCTSCCASTVPR